MKLELVIRKDVSNVELKRDEKQRLGISVRDGTQNEAGPIIKSIKTKSAAARSFAVAKGDVILSVNGCSTAGKKSKDVRRMLKKAGPAIDLQLLYKTQEARIFGYNVYRKQRLTIKLKKVNENFGFLLRKRISKHSFSMEYPVVSNIKEGSQAHKSGQLHEGDHLIMIDDVCLSWLSLPYIASLLMEKDEADFTFEYSIAVVSFPDNETKVDFEINAPIEDIGVALSTRDEDPTTLYISNIQPGSIAERCGIFSEGDAVTSVNDIAVKEMTVAKANSLLRGERRGRKMSFIAHKRREEPADNQHEDCCISTQDERTTTESYCSRSNRTDWGHVNTPASSYFIFSAQQRYNFQRFCYSEHFRSMEKFQSLLSIMSSLKQNLSALTRKAFDGTLHRSDQNCTFCNTTPHTVRLCTSCLARMNVKCAQSMDVLRKIVAHFVRLSTDIVNENQPFTVSVRNVIHTLTETLPNILRVPELQEHFVILAEKLANADTSCSICDFEVKSVVIIVQQLLLVLSIRDNSVEFMDLVEYLVNCLLEARFSCDEVSEHVTSTDDQSKSSSSITIDDESSSQSSSSGVRNNSETEFYDVYNSTDSLLNIPKSKTVANSDLFKLTHIQSLSESRKSVSVDLMENPSVSSSTVIENQVTFLDDQKESSSLVAVAAGGKFSNTLKKIRKGIKISRVWRSLDSFSFKKSTDVHSITHNSCPTILEEQVRTSFKEVAHPNTPVSTRKISSHLRPDCSTSHICENLTYYNNQSSSSSSSSRQRTESGISMENKKTRAEIMKVNLSNEGKGFGLDIGFCDSSTPSVVIIQSISPKSPAQKLGILRVGDRILAVNNRSTRTLSLTQLLSLKRRTFGADTISLLVEIDVLDEDYKFGTFDVVLNRTLKIGMIFEEIHKGYPVVISGIMKGSGAHRCGQLFPGDQLTFFRCLRNEEFDPISCTYIKEENVIVTVQREPKDVPGVLERPETPSPCYVNPCFQHDDFSPRDGSNFIVKSTAVHAIDGKDELVVENEVTLFRDSSTYDFGILLGENPDTGHAYVSDIRPNGPADKSGVIKKLDRIVEVNGVLVDRNVKNSVLDLLDRATHKVDLLIQRVYHEELTDI